MLQVLLFFFALFQAPKTGTCRVAPEVGEAVVKAHNAVRAQVATRGLYKKIFGNAPGSRSLFKLGYDRSHAALAAAMIGSRCKHSKMHLNGLEKSENFKTYRLDGAPNNKTLLQYFLYAVEDWRDSVRHPLRPDVKYTDTSMEPFANMIYYKTLKFGCAYRFCQPQSKIALACVYDNKPRLDEPLYLADSKNKKGCMRDYPCKKIISNAICETDGDKTGPLCDVPQPKVNPIIESGRITLSPGGYSSFTLPPGPSGEPRFTVVPRTPGEMREQPQYGLPISLDGCQVQQIAGLPAYILRCQDQRGKWQGTAQKQPGMSGGTAQYQPGMSSGTAQHQPGPSSQIFICDVEECRPGTVRCQGKYQLFCQEQQQQYNPQQQNQPLRCDVNQKRFQAAQQHQVVLPTLVCQLVQPQNGFMVQGMNPGATPWHSYNVVYSLPFNRTSNSN